MVAGAPAARFDLTDHHGKRVTAGDFVGSYLLVYFGFTHCKVVCPRSLTKLSRVLDQIGERAEKIVPLYVTVDPERDTPEVMRSYLEANYRRFTGLTGTREQIDAAKMAFRVSAEQKPDPDDPEGYVVPHTAIAYLMAPDGSYCAHFTDAADEAKIVGRLQNLVP